MTGRTDPWRWYCRICDERGEADTEIERGRAAEGHVVAEHWRAGDRMGSSGSGRLLHVWCYSRSYG